MKRTLMRSLQAFIITIVLMTTIVVQPGIAATQVNYGESYYIQNQESSSENYLSISPGLPGLECVPGFTKHNIFTDSVLEMKEETRSWKFVSTSGAEDGTPVSIGDMVYLQNQGPDVKSYLNACGLVYPASIDQVYVYTNEKPDWAGVGTGIWKIVSASGAEDGTPVSIDDLISLENQWTFDLDKVGQVQAYSFLRTCNPSSCDLKLEYGNSIIGDKDLPGTGAGVWKIKELTINDQVETIGEYGTLTNLNHNWQTITLNQNYINPVVIVSDPTFNGGQPATVRLQNVTGNSFELRIQEVNYQDDVHALETVSYLVVEAGDWELSDGTRISAGTQNSNLLSSQGFETVAISEFDQTPTLLTQVQTYNGPDWVTTRTKNMTANSFDLTMQEEEALNDGGHTTETIGWLAIDQGMGNDGDTLLQGGLTERTHTHIPETVNFEQAFNEIPIVFAKLGSYFGPEPANIRLGSISNSGFEARVHEERSLDKEIKHIDEQIAFLALGDSSGLFTGSLIKP